MMVHHLLLLLWNMLHHHLTLSVVVVLIMMMNMTMRSNMLVNAARFNTMGSQNQDQVFELMDA